jgi:hypothetical protein
VTVPYLHGSGGYFVDDEDCFVFGFFAAVILGLNGYGYVLALLSICPGYIKMDVISVVYDVHIPPSPSSTDQADFFLFLSFD